MKRAGKIIFALAILTLLAFFVFVTHPIAFSAAPLKQSANVAATNPDSNLVATNHLIASSEKSEPLIGEAILRGYGTSASTPENDLTLMAHLMDNFSLLVKSAANRPMSINEDWAAAFRGMNPAHERFLPDQHVALNASGQLVDRWQTPLFFHPLGNHRFEIRSAGPDKTMWTEDDLHRNAAGSFRRGMELNPTSLFDASRKN